MGQDHIVVDKGHCSRSSGRTVIEFFVKRPHTTFAPAGESAQDLPPVSPSPQENIINDTMQAQLLKLEHRIAEVAHCASASLSYCHSIHESLQYLPDITHVSSLRDVVDLQNNTIGLYKAWASSEKRILEKLDGLYESFVEPT